MFTKKNTPLFLAAIAFALLFVTREHATFPKEDKSAKDGKPTQSEAAVPDKNPK